MTIIANNSPRTHSERHSTPQRGTAHTRSAASTAIHRITAGIGRCYEQVKRRRDDPDTTGAAAPGRSRPRTAIGPPDARRPSPAPA
jgi:hypothetical protein